MGFQMGAYGSPVTGRSVSAVLGGDQVCNAGTPTTVLTTPILDTGLWLIIATAAIEPNAAAVTDAQLFLAAGTATCTFSGPITADGVTAAVTTIPVALTVATLVNVTVAGTVLARVQSIAATTAKQTATAGATGNATGLVALKLQ